MKYQNKKAFFSKLMTGIFASASCAAWADVSPGGIFLEPSLTYEVSNSSINYPTPLSNSSGTINGLGVGGRLGVHISDIFFAGVDARFAMPQFKDSSTNYDSKSTLNNWGPMVGLQTPYAGVRVWGTYLLGGELNPDASGNLDVKFTNATGYRLGAGLRISMVSVNLEYQDLKYGKTSLEQIGPFSTTTNFDSVNLNNKSWVASVSFPVAL
jgi:hypothetical protein